MTRIHEALTKAAQEHSGTDPGGAVQLDFSPVADPELNNSLTSGVGALRSLNGLTQSSTEALKFEDVQQRCSHPEWSPDPAVDVFAGLGSRALGAEQFRTLRSRLCQIRSHRPLRTVLITSAVAGEGKTFVAVNLAQSIVQQPDQRALLIDADLRSSRLHQMLGAPSAPGLSDYLAGHADEPTVMQSRREGNLYFIPSGTKIASPSELLANGRLKRLIRRVAPLFDWIIVDSPPCLPVTDANVIADACDALLLVIKAYSTPAEIAQRAKEELHGRNLLGVVFNSVNEKIVTYGPYTYPEHAYEEVKHSKE